MNDFINERWRPILAFNGLNDFEALWQFPGEWFEAPNQRRGGWSGVLRCELRLPEGGVAAIFLKRQENHTTRSFFALYHGVPTFLREFKRIMTYRRHAIPSLEPVYFGMRGRGKHQRAILVTEELTGFVSLENLVTLWKESAWPPRDQRLPVLQSVVMLLRKMHTHGVRHGCFFPKHVFVRASSQGAEARVIDLEKSRWRPFKTLCSLRDLYSLSYDSSPFWSRADQLRFLLAYLGIPRLNAYAKWLWRRIARHISQKSEARANKQAQ